MTIEELYEIIHGKRINTDTRKLNPGDIYFALKGDHFDGNQFTQQAFEQGASYAIVDNVKFAGHKNILYVPDVLETLQELAVYHIQKLNIPVIAITGSNGKTTTKELIRTVLDKKYHVSATIGNLNNHIGVPLTVLRFSSETEIGIVEMGANHIGEIRKLCHIARPGYGLITNIGKAHLEGFGSKEGVRKAKGELYEYIYQKGGTLFINSSDRVLKELWKEFPAKTISYGESNDNLVTGKNSWKSAFLEFEYRTNSGQKDKIQTQLIGGYNFSNALAAVTLGVYFKVPSQDIKLAIEGYQPDNFRSQYKKTNHNELIIDAYNANPTSMKLAIENFSRQSTGQKLLIMGDMMELGKDTASEHQNIIQYAGSKGIDNIITVGPRFEQVNKTHIRFKDVNELSDYLKMKQLQGYLVLMKGSRLVQLEKCIPFL